MVSILAARTVTDKKIKYSTMEIKLLGLLSKGAVISSDELVNKLYKVGEVPYYARESVTATLRTLMRKIEHNKEPFIITKTSPGGPYPTRYQKLKR